MIGLVLGVLASLALAALTFFTFEGPFLAPRHQEIARSFLHAVIDHDRPDDGWNRRLGRELRREGDHLFYLFKVWTIEDDVSDWDVTMADARLSRCSDSSVDISLLWRRRGIPDLQMCVSRRGETMTLESVCFPMNNCLFDPDKNRDGVVDSVDVRLAVGGE